MEIITHSVLESRGLRGGVKLLERQSVQIFASRGCRNANLGRFWMNF